MVKAIATYKEIDEMRCHPVCVALFFVACLTSPAFSAEDDHFRVGVGGGVPYGGIGASGEYLFNAYGSVGAGLGYFRHDGPGWSLGARLYPIKNTGIVNPRLTGYFGRLGTVDRSDGSHEAYNGGALGGGFDWLVYRKLSLDFDLMYLVKDLPPGVKKNGNFGFSAGVGSRF